jgi:hypothetical protein
MGKMIGGCQMGKTVGGWVEGFETGKPVGE